MIIIQTLERHVRDLGPLLCGLLFFGVVKATYPWAIYIRPVQLIESDTVLVMSAGYGLSLLFMRLLEGWMIEARFRPVANLGLFFFLAGGLVLSILFGSAVAGLVWLMFWVGSLAKLVGEERTSRRLEWEAAAAADELLEMYDHVT